MLSSIFTQCIQWPNPWQLQSSVLLRPLHRPLRIYGWFGRYPVRLEKWTARNLY